MLPHLGLRCSLGESRSSDRICTMDFEPKLQNTEEICKRILALKALLSRSECEGYIHMSRKPNEIQGAKLAGDKLNEWIKKNEVYAFLSKKEREAIDVTVGEWDQKTFMNASWRVEAVSVLLWSLNFMDFLPPYDQEVGKDRVMSIFNPFNSLSIIQQKAVLKPVGQIFHMRDIAELWHWRANTTRIIKEKLVPKGFDDAKLLDICAQVSEKAYKDGEIPAPIDSDFPAYKKAYKDLTDEEFKQSSSIILERHFGSNWLCGYSNNWDETPTNT